MRGPQTQKKDELGPGAGRGPRVMELESRGFSGAELGEVLQESGGDLLDHGDVLV